MTRVVGFHIEGQPIPQGSLIGSKDGSGLHYYNRSELLAYRKRIKIAAVENWAANPSLLPISLIVVFSMRRPLQHYKGLHMQLKDKFADVEYHSTMPDIDKLARAVLDALTGTIYQDDAQVAQLRLAKRYSGVWGTSIYIRVLGQPTLWEDIGSATSGEADALQMGNDTEPSYSEGQRDLPFMRIRRG
jgi:Holliday junction resolvase RusA-like endonuclease